MGVDREKRVGVAGALTIGHFGEGKAVTKEEVFQLGVVEGAEDVKDGGNLFHPGGDDVAREGYVADWCPKEFVSFVGRARNSSINGVCDGGVERWGMDERLGRV